MTPWHPEYLDCRAVLKVMQNLTLVTVYHLHRHTRCVCTTWMTPDTTESKYGQISTVMSCILTLFHPKNQTNNPISSNSHPTATANEAIHNLKWGGGGGVHTCEPSDGRINSPFFLGHLPISNILLNSPEFYMFTWILHVHVPNMQFAPCEIWANKVTCNYWFRTVFHSAEVVDSQFRSCFNNFIYPPRVDYFTLGYWLFEYC